MNEENDVKGFLNHPATKDGLLAVMAGGILGITTFVLVIFYLWLFKDYKLGNSAFGFSDISATITLLTATPTSVSLCLLLGRTNFAKTLAENLIFLFSYLLILSLLIFLLSAVFGNPAYILLTGLPVFGLLVYGLISTSYGIAMNLRKTKSYVFISTVVLLIVVFLGEVIIRVVVFLGRL